MRLRAQQLADCTVVYTAVKLVYTVHDDSAALTARKSVLAVQCSIRQRLLL
jgi:hypothetical protein